MGASEVARQLYGLPRADFISARNAQVRELKGTDPELARQVAGFTKPSAAADLVNRLVRARTDLVDEVGDLGVRLRSAQRRSEAAELRGLDQERRALVNRAVDAAREVAEGSATDATLRDVEQTVWAAVVDAGAHAAFRAGVLVRPMAPGGFGDVDVSASSAVPVEVDTSAEDVAPVRSRSPRSATKKEAPARTGPTAAQQEARRKARRDVDAATEDLAGAEQAAAEAARLAEESEQLSTDLQQERDELRERLTVLEREARDTARQAKERQAAARTAERERRTAADRLDRARRRMAQAEES
ncbi:hypothetical protein [Aeromicrobium chenweiae]|uniref:Uncharacterized protein n=1 Tax=Aeromicrobium chenweiae TaxID=2079793 RepID=A0A2S0WQC9_9ACTN|nr:hypothetical protein [Aeromicrobium chenweiae]AWB93444.1 hypothetical protein C3E78_15165 [Aeromicrobium chenweiae]TGN34436.1 hypothetical protein E4L97_05185 [Aeromicrobium chenweiae]